MANSYFQFKQFTVHQELAAMKVTTDACLFGAWVAADLQTITHVPASVLDIGTGTGLLSLMIAQQTGAIIDAIEIDAAAAEQAENNFAKSPWADRLQLVHGDVRNKSFPDQYDIIVSNPPFYENELSGNNSRKNIAHHDEGLLLKELIDLVSDLANENGNIYFLLPYKRLEEISQLLSQKNWWIQKLCKIKQSTAHGFFRVLIKARKTQAEIIQEELAIRDSSNAYTPEFEELLKPYYLYL